MDAESTRALVVGLFVVSGRASLTASELIALAACRGVCASNLKSHLTRMVADGSLARSGAPRSYRYSPSRTRGFVIDSIRSRLQRRPSEPWDGTWLVLTLPRGLDRASRQKLLRRLRFRGFRPLSAGCFARPAWPAAGARSVAERLIGDAGGAFVIGPLAGERALSALLRSYGLPALDRRAARLLARTERALAAPPIGERAFALRLELGEPIARLFSEDPLLPPALWGELRALGQLAASFSKLDAALERGSRSFLDRLLSGPVRLPARSA